MAETLKRRADRQCRAGVGAGVAGDALSPIESHADRMVADRDGRAQRWADIEPRGIALRAAPAAGAEIERQAGERAERPRRADCAVGESFHPIAHDDPSLTIAFEADAAVLGRPEPA